MLLRERSVHCIRELPGAPQHVSITFHLFIVLVTVGSLQRPALIKAASGNILSCSFWALAQISQCNCWALRGLLVPRYRRVPALLHECPSVCPPPPSVGGAPFLSIFARVRHSLSLSLMFGNLMSVKWPVSDLLSEHQWGHSIVLVSWNFPFVNLLFICFARLPIRFSNFFLAVC